jgi:hypothetical protein
MHSRPSVREDEIHALRGHLTHNVDAVAVQDGVAVEYIGHGRSSDQNNGS